MRGRFVFAAVAASVALATMVAAPAQADATDAVFISVLDDQGFTYPSEAQAITAGRNVCDYLLDGNTLLDATSEVAKASDLSIEDAGFFVGAAAASYCPSEAP